MTGEQYATEESCATVPAKTATPRSKSGARIVAGVVVLLAVGLFYLPGIAWGFIVGMTGISVFLGQVATVGGVLLLSRPLKGNRLRLLVRAFALATAFTPFIPHAGVEWSMPFPPAGLSIALAVRRGSSPDPFEVGAIAFFTAVIWLALRGIQRNLASTPRVDDRSASTRRNRFAGWAEPGEMVEDILLGTLALALAVIWIGGIVVRFL